MGFLDHSTNNIIIDAVLTDTGRKMLADNRGRFKVAFFSLADDEVDYSIIQKYGRSVGKEKISKNTPIFEAQTQSTLALKNRLLTLPDPTIIRLPRLSASSTSISGDTLLFRTQAGQMANGAGTASTSNEVTIEQTIQGETDVPDGVSDTTFTVLVPDRFLTIQDKTEVSIEATTRTAYYIVTRWGVNTQNGAIVKFTLTTLGRTLDDTIFNIYGDEGNKNTISTVVSVIGDQSGIRKDFACTIERPQ